MFFQVKCVQRKKKPAPIRYDAYILCFVLLFFFSFDLLLFFQNTSGKKQSRDTNETFMIK
jgi:hypothetical protein